MIAQTVLGSFKFPTLTGDHRSSQRTMDAAVQTLNDRKKAWADLPAGRKIAIVDELIADCAATAEHWVAASLEAKGIEPGGPSAWEEWAGGPYVVMRILRLLRQSLLDIERFGRPRISGGVTTRPDGQVVAQVFPQRSYDRIFSSGVTAEVRMQPGVTREGLPETQALMYHGVHAGKVTLVLGAGNVSSVGASDILEKLFVQNEVVLYKVNPVNAYMGPLFEESFRPLVAGGYLRIVYGGAEEGSYLCAHQGVDEVHVTGSDKTFEAVVFGTGPGGSARKAKNRPLLDKPVTAELGNVSPVIVVPGPWSESDLAYQGDHIASMLIPNAGFNCLTARVIIQHAGWRERGGLLDRVRSALGGAPTRKAYYPGSRQRYETFLSAHPLAETFGNARDGELPWTLIPDVDPGQRDEVCFTTEAFCSLMSETALQADSVAQYLDRAVEFANERLWGTLVATILVHPSSLTEPGVAEALDRATANLRYGSVTINQGAGTAYILGVTPWGAFAGRAPRCLVCGRPASPPGGVALDDIQSGVGFVHNTLMFERPQKSVVRGPFRARTTPPWHPSRARGATRLLQKLNRFEAAPSAWKVPGILRAAMS